MQVSAEPPTECEVLYGRCGYLHACLFARSAAAAAGVAPPASVVPDATLRAIAQQARISSIALDHLSGFFGVFDFLPGCGCSCPTR